MRKLDPYWPCITKRGEVATNVGTAQTGVVAYQRWPSSGPTEMLNQLARQTKRKVKRTDPAMGFVQPTFKYIKRFDKLDF
jgi:hypothetical protein